MRGTGGYKGDLTWEEVLFGGERCSSDVLQHLQLKLYDLCRSDELLSLAQAGLDLGTLLPQPSVHAFLTYIINPNFIYHIFNSCNVSPSDMKTLLLQLDLKCPQWTYKFQHMSLSDGTLLGSHGTFGSWEPTCQMQVARFKPLEGVLVPSIVVCFLIN